MEQELQYYDQKVREVDSDQKAACLTEMNGCIRLLEENSIQTINDLETTAQNLFNQADDILSHSREVAGQIRELDNKIILGEIIEEIRPVIEQMNAIHWKKSREKFQIQHQDEIDRYYSAKRVLKEKHGVTKYSIQTWKQKKSQLLKQKSALESQHAPLKKKVDQLITIQHRINEAQRIESREHNRKRQIVRN